MKDIYFNVYHMTEPDIAELCEALVERGLDKHWDTFEAMENFPQEFEYLVIKRGNLFASSTEHLEEETEGCEFYPMMLLEASIQEELD